MADERKTEFGYFACKKAKLSASEVPGEVVGSSEEDLRCRNLLTVCQKRLGLSEAEDTKLEYYSFLKDRMSLWYWLRRDLKRTSQQQSECVSRCFQHGGGWTKMHGGWQKTMSLMETGAY